MFATGIENSIPTIDNGRTRVDQMEASDHYRRWRRISTALRILGSISCFGPPLHKTFFAPGQYDWEFCDLTMSDLKRRDITPIVDCVISACRLDRQFPEPGFPAFVCDLRWPPSPSASLGAPAGQRDVHLRRLLGEYGWWNEQLKTDRSSSPPQDHRPRQRPGDDGNPQAPAGRDFHPERVSEYPRRQPGGNRPAERSTPPLPQPRSQLRRRVDSGMYEYLMDNGMTRRNITFLHTR